MGFDGILRPSQLTPNLGPMNPYLAANAAHADEIAKPLVKSLSKEQRVKSLEKEQRNQQNEDDEEEGEAFSEEEAEQIRLMAKMRGIMNFSLEQGAKYEFRINAQTGRVDLVELSSGKVVLQVEPSELMQLSEKIHRYAGILTDRCG